MKIGSKFYWQKSPDGTMMILYEDDEAAFAGFDDTELSYSLDRENADKLKAVLSKTHEGYIGKMMKEEFGEDPSLKDFLDYCRKNGIECRLSPKDTYDF